MKLTQKVDADAHRVMLFGGPKTGKTQLCSDLTLYFNLLYFDLENGYKVFRKLPQEQQDKIEIISIPDTKADPVAINTMLKVWKMLPVDICHAHGRVACATCKKSGGSTDHVDLGKLDPNWIVIVDSGSQLSSSCMNHIMSKRDDDYKPEWNDYMQQGALLDMVLSSVQQAPFHVIFITHEVEAELEDGRKKLVPAMGTANYARNCAKFFDHVVYCQVKSKDHAFGSATSYGLSLLTGSRTDVAIEELEYPSLLSIFKPDAPEVVRKLGRAAKKLDKSEANSAAEAPAVAALGGSLMDKIKLRQQGGEAAKSE